MEDCVVDYRCSVGPEQWGTGKQWGVGNKGDRETMGQGNNGEREQRDWAVGTLTQGGNRDPVCGKQLNPAGKPITAC